MQIIPMFKGAKTDNKIFKSDSQNLFQSFLDKPHIYVYISSFNICGLKNNYWHELLTHQKMWWMETVIHKDIIC